MPEILAEIAAKNQPEADGLELLDFARQLLADVEAGRIRSFAGLAGVVQRKVPSHNRSGAAWSSFPGSGSASGW